MLPKSGDNASLSYDQIAIPTPPESGLASPEPRALAGVRLGKEVDLFGEGEPELPGVKAPALSFTAAPSHHFDPTVPLVASGRIVPVADKDGKQIVGWRILGEIFNGTQELLENAQILVELSQSNSKTKNILHESVQSGGFIPLKSGDRGVYDILIAASSLQEPGEEFSTDRISIGVRRLTESTGLIRLNVRDLKFTPLKAESGTVYKVTATITNNLKIPVVGPILKFWAVVDRGEIPQGARTAYQVIVVATWESPQEILASGQSKKMETTLVPLTQSDRQLTATNRLALRPRPLDL